jgi:fructokinase
MQELGLTSRYVRPVATHPTGVATVTVDDLGQPSFLIQHPAAYDFPELSGEELAQLTGGSPDLVYFGTLCQMSAQARALTCRLLDLVPGARRFYDVNLRPESYEPELVLELMSRASMVKVNEDEVRVISRMFNWGSESLEAFCRRGVEQFGWEGSCVTRSERGCVLLVGDKYVASHGYKVTVRDTIGAGDAFSAALAHGLASAWPADAIADFANRVGALVASHSGAIPAWTLEEAAALRQ